jgi:hypothetical protein
MRFWMISRGAVDASVHDASPMPREKVPFWHEGRPREAGPLCRHVRSETMREAAVEPCACPVASKA